ncbi:hypothetical protein BD779DRAFT_1473793 [Infundibulicybe gibba]|nr:hypothetical protein BD779DRAFT_1473793 [Infundibulicybe gibba]
METTRFNAAHDELAVLLARNGAVRHFYNAGSVFGVIGVLGSLILVISSVADSLAAIWPAPLPPLSKRELSPIIPGVTVPFADVPLILLDLFLSQAFHELGHAIAAAVDDIPLNSVGISPILSAFVSLPAASVAALPPLSRLRIAAAGAHHNLIAYAFLALFAASPLPLWLRNVAFTDISHLGRLVVHVHSDSPLYSHLPSTSLITTVDDTPANRWTEYLTSPDPGHDPGCLLFLPVTFILFLFSDDAPRSCCPSSTGLLTCFLSIDSSACLDPIRTLTVHDAIRCTPAHPCAPLHTCVTPHPSTHLTRLTVIPPQKSGPEILLWSGPRLEIFEQVIVTSLAARSILLPVELWDALRVFFWYASSAALSLFFSTSSPSHPSTTRPLIWLTSRAARHSGGIDAYALLESNRPRPRILAEHRPITPRRRAANSHLRLRAVVHAATLVLVVCAILAGAVRAAVRGM